MRITAGSMRGRNVQVPDIPGLRPTPSRVREALFNIIREIENFRVLDLFSGSGIIALETLSRGATSAISIEQNRKACNHLNQLRQTLSLEESWQLLPGKLPQALQRIEPGSHFDLVFADPPYEKGFAEKIPAWLAEHQIHCDWLVIEESARVNPCWPSGWLEFKVRSYGDTTLHFLEPKEV